MRSASPPSILVLAFLQGSPIMQPLTTAACDGVRRIELSSPHATAAREIRVSPGLMTSFLFDTPAVVDLQDEVRFMVVTRGRSSISFLPPEDMAPGERLRLTARIGDGTSQENATFTLVAHSGQATHQVEVYRDKRPRESYQHEVAQERAKVQQLLTELEHMRSRLKLSGGLLGLITSGALKPNAIQSQEYQQKPKGYSESGLIVTRGVTYRSNKSVAVEVWLENSGTETWTAVGASLTVKGKPLEIIWQAETIPPNKVRQVVVEVDAIRGEPRGDATLSLWEAGPRVINIPEITFP